MSKIHLAALHALAWVAVSLAPAAPACRAEQTLPRARFDDGQDPTRPRPRLDLRVKRSELEHGESSRAVTMRADSALPLHGGWMLSLRGELAFVMADAAGDAGSESGVADALVQTLLIAPSSRSFTSLLGAQVVLPTAREHELGDGRYQLVPTIGTRYDLGEWRPGAWTALLVREAIDVGGRDERERVSQLVIQPVLDVPISRRWFLNLAPEVRYDWNRRDWHVPFSLIVGMLSDDGAMVFTVEVRSALADALPLYETEVELRVGYLF